MIHFEQDNKIVSSSVVEKSLSVREQNFWHPIKNSDLTINTISVGSNRKVWWQCSSGHEWVESVVKRVNAVNGCPYCANQRVWSGFNDLETLFPNTAKQWHPTKNGELLPENVLFGSTKRVWWKCELNHEWEVDVRSRTHKNSTGCPICSNQKVLVGFNDVQTTHPNLSQQWHPTRNGELLPTMVTVGSRKRVWWKCELNHEWESFLYSRRDGRKNCPKCSGRTAIKGETDCISTHPHLNETWHPTRNKELNKNVIKSQSHTKVWWLGDCGHEWETYIYNRTNGKNCPKCSINVSKAEKNVLAFLRNLNLTIEENNKTILNGLELDMFIPSKNVAIEFNGLYWHSESKGKNKYYHYNKWLECKKQGIQLIQIWEDEWNKNSTQIKKMLAHKLGVAEEPKTFARKTTVTVLTKEFAETFLNLNHIQGYASGSYYLGLKEHNNESVVAVIVLKKESGKNLGGLNIVRYATKNNVIGGFTKLLTYAEKTFKPTKFLTFSDHCVSDGGLYKNNGFIADKELPPDYMYIINGARQHKFGYRLKRFKNDPNLLWKDGYTERQLAELNGLERVWDAGKTRWTKILKT